ncbi:MAG: DUF5681 domain-containing protein [Parvularculaceae bacterium]
MHSKAPDKGTGYRNPPKEFQFRKGQSGNPNGRPRGAKNKKTPSGYSISNLLVDEANREIKVLEKGQIVTITTLQAITRTMMAKAAKGDHRSQKLATDLISRAQERVEQEKIEHMKLTIKYLSAAKRTVEQCLNGELHGDLPPVHPSDIVIDHATGEASILELNEDAKWRRDWITQRLGEMANEVRTLRNEAAKRGDSKKADRLRRKASRIEACRASMLKKFLNSSYMQPPTHGEPRNC